MSGQNTAAARKRPREHFVPQILVDSLKIGGCTGALGVLVGAAAGVVRGRPPALNAVIAGVQWFTLGSTYYGSKAMVTSAWAGRDTNLSQTDLIKASAAAGGFAGAASGLFAGPRNVPPALIAFSLLGAGGQAVANAVADRRKTRQEGNWLSSKWSPLTPLTDQQFQSVLEERILEVEVEIALIDDKIARLQAPKPQQKEKS